MKPMEVLVIGVSLICLFVSGLIMGLTVCGLRHSPNSSIVQAEVGLTSLGIQAQQAVLKTTISSLGDGLNHASVTPSTKDSSVPTTGGSDAQASK